ncbi:MAG: 2-C-methyl-D-erythritol 2,4-cyclodiphosphate synthase, partial [Ruminococcus sp.]|nr:2-C-methyl-D-erythritol 2,4-cyclodiphosphate synthase [Ruminococcus sp.]
EIVGKVTGMMGSFENISFMCKDLEKVSGLLKGDAISFLIDEKGYKVGNIDATIIAERPKLAGYIDDMRKNIADACGCDVSQISVKATTEEKLGFTGEMLGVSAHSVALLMKK